MSPLNSFFDNGLLLWSNSVEFVFQELPGGGFLASTFFSTRFALAAPQPLFQVVLDAALEVRSAVVYATFIVALVFLPVLTLTGVQGSFFAPLALSYILAILASLLVAGELLKAWMASTLVPFSSRETALLVNVATI